MKKYIILEVDVSEHLELDENALYSIKKVGKKSGIVAVGQLVDFGCNPMPLEDICEEK